ncbi:uncharacterized protein LOC143276323 isoform X2 [Babylonia areolata]
MDGREIESVDEDEIRAVVEEIRGKGVTGIVLCGIFSPTRTEQEEKVKKLISEVYPEASVTMSHTIGHIGLLERENAAILNEAVKALCQRTVSGFRQALQDIGLSCPLFLTQNDGTVISERQAMETPVFAFASGPTNSMRGAAYLCQVTDAVVVDIGGTTTDVGVLKNRFPRQASTDVRVGGVRTNFRMPDVHSVGLGGGSYVLKTDKGKTLVGPLSAGYNLMKEALVFGTESGTAGPQSGRRVTATDVAVAAGLMDLGDKTRVTHLPRDDVTAALKRMQKTVEDAIDSVRVSSEPLPVILVGGGSKLLDSNTKMPGVSEILLPDHYGVANAIGAALSQVSGNIDSVVSLEKFMDTDVMETRMQQAKRNLPPGATQEQIDEAVSAVRKPLLEAARDKAVQDTCRKARQMAQQAGADPATLEIVEMEEVALTYLPGCATRIKVKAVGNLLDSAFSDCGAVWTEPPGIDVTESDVTADVPKQLRSVTGDVLDDSQSDSNTGVTWAGLTPSRPHVDPRTGEWIVNAWDVECITVGAGLLGAGGGGSPHIGRVCARVALEKGKKMRIISPERLVRQTGADNVSVCIGHMGAPLVAYEQLFSGQEVPDSYRCLQELYSVGGYTDGDITNKAGVKIEESEGVAYIDDYQPNMSSAASGQKVADNYSNQVVGMLCGEVGGCNAMQPLLVSSSLDLPVVDADAMGRAFPMLQMLLPFIHGEKPYPAAMVDDKGRRAVILRSETAQQVEDHFRKVCVQMGSAAGLAFAAIRNSVVMKKTILRSYSRVWTIGDSILRARQNKQDPIQALMAVEDVKALAVGKICDVTRETSGGFTRGRVQIEGVAYDPARTAEDQTDDGGEMLRLVLDFQNENLVVRKMDEKGKELQIMAVVPDVISIMDAATAEPISTEELRYGQRVMVITLPAPSRMTSPEALQVVGPAAFGCPDVEFAPLGRYREPEPLAPV